MINTARRLVQLRTEIIAKNPFFGRLLMRLPFAFGECETAYTDMQKIVFDPAFAARLGDRELTFVLLHELMHCVLKHCTRSRGKIHLLYNIACDIVVNSIVLEALGLSDIEVDGSKAMHITPLGDEGRDYSAEEVYNLLLKDLDKDIQKQYGASLFDNHDVWREILNDSILDEVWNKHIKDASKGSGHGSGIPNSLQRVVEAINHTPQIAWRHVLHDFIQHKESDYVFAPPDKRYSGDFILPSFQNDVAGHSIDDIWFFIDTSASVSGVAISEAFEEIKDSINQVGNMKGYIFFFDCSVSEPIPFESVEDIVGLKPIGGGGTDFHIIFDKVKQLEEDPPKVIVVITDGYATFPSEDVSLGIPTIWLITDSDVRAPWGECIHINTRK